MLASCFRWNCILRCIPSWHFLQVCLALGDYQCSLDAVLAIILVLQRESDPHMRHLLMAPGLPGAGRIPVQPGRCARHHEVASDGVVILQVCLALGDYQSSLNAVLAIMQPGTGAGRVETVITMQVPNKHAYSPTGDVCKHLCICSLSSWPDLTLRRSSRIPPRISPSCCSVRAYSHPAGPV